MIYSFPEVGTDALVKNFLKFFFSSNTIRTIIRKSKYFGKNEQIKKVFWTVFMAMAGLVMARVVDPVTAQQVVGAIMGMGV